MSDIAIIGHGCHPVGKGWGPGIDGCDTVIRMWNWQWQNPADYGERYDWGFYEISPTEMARFKKHNCRWPKVGWIASLLLPYVEPLPLWSHIISPVKWEQMGQKMGGAGTKGRLRLTRGARAAAWAIEHAKPGADRIILIGFDNAYAGTGLPPKEAFPEAYLASPATFPLRDYTGGTTKYGNHDYAIEAPLLKALAADAQVQLVFGQDWVK